MLEIPSDSGFRNDKPFLYFSSWNKDLTPAAPWVRTNCLHEASVSLWFPKKLSLTKICKFPHICFLFTCSTREGYIPSRVRQLQLWINMGMKESEKELTHQGQERRKSNTVLFKKKHKLANWSDTHWEVSRVLFFLSFSTTSLHQ